MRFHAGSIVAVFALSFSPVVSTGVLAGDHQSACKIDVDIDELDADLYPDGEAWRLKVRYEVDVEHAGLTDRLELRISYSDDDRLLIDAEGRPLGLTVRLNRPTEIDDDEMTFKGGLEIRLPLGAVAHPDDFDVHASVHHAGDARRLDDDSTSATPHYPIVVVECAPPAIVYPVPAVPCEPRLVNVAVVPHRGVAVEVRRRPVHVRVNARW